MLDQPEGEVRAGLTSFSACLVGTVTVELVPLLYGQPVNGVLFLWVVVISALRSALRLRPHSGQLSSYAHTQVSSPATPTITNVRLAL